MAENEDRKEKNEEKDVLDAYYGVKAFVKIKQCLEIGKMLLSFVSLKNAADHIDCYMEAEEFGALLMDEIRTGVLRKKLIEEKNKGEQYPKSVWTSNIGGNPTENNGKPICRFFTISPGSTQEVVIKASMYPAHVNSTGAYIIDKDENGKLVPPLLTLTVGLPYNGLKITQYKWSFLEKDYMTKKYCMENMKSNWHSKAASSEQSNTPQSTANNDTNIREFKPATTQNNKQLPQIDTSKYPVYELKTLTQIQEFGSYGNLCFKVISKDNKEYACIIILADLSLLKKDSKWNDFQDNASKKTGIRVKLYIDDSTTNGRLLVKGIV